ncbi:MAG: 50S ribosomal protein L10 [Candidatus Parvarchaeota archaeon]|jgi:large subunit ribosomal protein L10|nr:50S ribosomal protein L10 [Candidatus Parvarchaeota archaeon]
MKKSKGSAAKAKQVQELSVDLKKYKTVAVVELSGFPSRNFEEIRKAFRGNADFVYKNKVVILRALEKIDQKLVEKASNVKIPVLLLSDMSPFELAKVAIQNTAYAKIKPGETASEDIILPSGPTPFPPGPMLSQFSSIGVKTKNEGGKISIVSDVTVVKKGHSVNEKVASILSSMDIKPKELVLSIENALNSGIVFERSILYKSIDDYTNAIKTFFRSALSLSMGAGIVNKYTIKPIITKLYIGVRFLSVDRNIVSKSTIKDILVKASVGANSLAGKIGGE